MRNGSGVQEEFPKKNNQGSGGTFTGRFRKALNKKTAIETKCETKILFPAKRESYKSKMIGLSSEDCSQSFEVPGV